MSDSLQSPRLKLRKIAPSDIDKVFEGLSHPDVVLFYGVSYDSLEATRKQMAWFQELEEREKGQWWAILRKEDGAFVGAGGFNGWSHSDQKAEIGFWLLPEYWGLGYMREALPVICQFGFEEMNLHRIEGYVDSANQNCLRALTKIGFIHEGRMRDCEVKGDRRVSIDIYSKLRND